jgi:TRAP-type C4-dicarboxylate transport system permease small subunit
LFAFFIATFIIVISGAIYHFFRTLKKEGLGFNPVLNALDSGLTFFENWTLFITVMAGLVSLFVNVILRYGFNFALAWSEELIREIIIYTTFIGSSAAIKNRNMITIDALPQLVPRLKIPLLFISHAATVVFSVIITILGYKMAMLQVMTSQKTIILQIPLVVLYVILPLMGVMMFIRAIQVIHKDIHSYFIRREEAS